MFRSTRILVVITIFGLMGAATAAAAAQGETSEGIPLPANSAYCEPGYLGPFVGCTPWSGVTVTYTSSDGTFEDSCTTQEAIRAATCAMYVPFGSTITASIDPAVVPSGYVLEGEASRTFDIPDGPPQGLYGGPSFVLLPAEDDAVDALVTALIAILVEILAESS